jgi:hypothetical protein
MARLRFIEEGEGLWHMMEADWGVDYLQTRSGSVPSAVECCLLAENRSTNDMQWALGPAAYAVAAIRVVSNTGPSMSTA